MENKMESSNESSLFSSSLASAEVQGDSATPSLMDLSTGLMGLDSGLANTDDHQGSLPPGSDAGPLFDPTTERNVTVLVGRTANLHCRVRYLGNRTVSHLSIDCFID